MGQHDGGAGIRGHPQCTAEESSRDGAPASRGQERVDVISSSRGGVMSTEQWLPCGQSGHHCGLCIYSAKCGHEVSMFKEQ